MYALIPKGQPERATESEGSDGKESCVSRELGCGAWEGKETPLDSALAVPWRAAAERELQVSEGRVRKQQRRNRRASKAG